MKKHLVWMIGIALVFSMSCAKSEQDTGGADSQTASKEPIKIGAIFAITGGAAFLGEPERNTAVMLVDEINANGGIDGRPVELLVEDTEGLADNGVKAVRKLINQDGVCAIIGPSRTGVTMAVIPIVEESEIPLISCAAAEVIVKPVKKWVFKTPQTDSDCVWHIYTHMKSQGLTKVALITGTTAFGNAGREQLKKFAPEMGISIVADETYNPGDTDMTAQLTQIKGTDAQAIVNWSIVSAQSIVPKNMKQLEISVPLYQSHGFGNLKFVENAGPAADGIIFPGGVLLAADSLPDNHPRKPLLLKYKNDYEGKFGGNVSTFGGHSYDALTLVVDALKAVGDDPAKIRDHIETISGFHGTAGTFSFSAEDHNGLTKDAFSLIKVEGGKFVLFQL